MNTQKTNTPNKQTSKNKRTPNDTSAQQSNIPTAQTNKPNQKKHGKQTDTKTRNQTNKEKTNSRHRHK